MGRKQFIVTILLLLPIFSYASTRLPNDQAQRIVAFTLYNYDNLIADCYEKDSPYISQLSRLLSAATGVSGSVYSTILKSKELSSESVPVQYMLRLNRKMAEVSNYYLVDE